MYVCMYVSEIMCMYVWSRNVACEVVSLLQSTNLKTVATMSDKEDEVSMTSTVCMYVCMYVCTCMNMYVCSICAVLCIYPLN